jgi:hypothetical protein
MHLLMKIVTDVVNSSMPSDETLNIFQSVLAKLSCRLASASMDHFCIERVKSNQTLFVTCAEYNKCRPNSEMLTYKP